MAQLFNIYCDESCHLEHDAQQVMLFGAVWCSADRTREIATRMREIKQRHGLAATFEIKWTKVSPARLDFYVDVLDYFFDDDDISFRVLVVPDKNLLQHELFNQDHDTFYYKMYFNLLKVLLSPQDHYRIWIDIKDTHSHEKVAKLADVLCNNMYDFDRKIITSVQTVRSHEVEQIQLCDLLTGIISYANRGLADSAAKRSLVERMQKRSGYSLTKTTLLREKKVNILRWEPQEGLDES